MTTTNMAFYKIIVHGKGKDNFLIIFKLIVYYISNLKATYYQ